MAKTVSVSILTATIAGRIATRPKNTAPGRVILDKTSKNSDVGHQASQE